MIPSAVFVPALSLQTKFSLSKKFSRNLGNMRKTSAHVLSISRKQMTGSLGTSFGVCCVSSLLTAACYWVSHHWIHTQTFVRIGRDKSQRFIMGVGLPQGCAFWPLTYDQAGMEISTKKTKVIFVSRNPRQRRLMLQVSGNTRQHVHVLSTLGWYSRVAEGGEKDTDTRTRKANVILSEHYHSLFTKRELSNTVKLSNFKLVFALILTYGINFV